MGAIVNGLTLSKLRPFGATFFIFTDYARPAIRLATLMELPSLLVFTHDAMGDGEDGPTHQPVEHLASLRAMPGFITLRPGMPMKWSRHTAMSCNCSISPRYWRYRGRPCRLSIAPSTRPHPASRRGLMCWRFPGGNPEVIIIASGSEVSLAVQAHKKLLAECICSRLVSMASWEIFEHQPLAYRDSVLPPNPKARVAVEQASTFGWERSGGTSGQVVGMNTFGASAPLKDLQRKFAFEPDQVVGAAKQQLGRK
jgi:transketolase